MINYTKNRPKEEVTVQKPPVPSLLQMMERESREAPPFPFFITAITYQQVAVPITKIYSHWRQQWRSVPDPFETKERKGVVLNWMQGRMALATSEFNDVPPGPGLKLYGIVPWPSEVSLVRVELLARLVMSVYSLQQVEFVVGMQYRWLKRKKKTE